MTQDNPNHDEILNTLRSILSLISWLGIPAIGALTIVISALIADHFDQVNLRRDDNWMKPKVSKLWYEKHPDYIDNEP